MKYRYTWEPSIAINVGDAIVPTTPNGFIYVASVAGTTGATEPTWSTSQDGSTSDNTVTFKTRREFVCTARASGGDYTTLSGWDAANQCDLTTALVFGHGGITGSIADGSSVTQKVSGATGTVTHVTSSQVLIHTITGTFDSTNQIYETIDTNYVVPTDAGHHPISALDVYDDWVGLDDFVNMGGTTDSTHYPVMFVPATERHDGTPRTGFYLEVDTGSAVAAPVKIDCLYGRAIGFDVNNTRTSTYRGGYDLTKNQAVVAYCIGEAVDGTIFEGVGTGGGYTNWPLAYACLAIGNGTADGGYGRNANVNYKTIRAYNSVAVDCVVGFESGNTWIAVYKNCVGYSNTTDYQSGQDTTNSNYNASSDTSANVFTNYVTGVASGDFADAANEDYHLSGTGSSLYQAGTPVSGFVVDIDGDTYDASTPSIGFDEYAATGVTVTADLGLNTLWQSANDSDISIPASNRASIQASMVLPAFWHQAAVSDAVVPARWLLAVHADQAVPALNRAGVVGDAGVPVLVSSLVSSDALFQVVFGGAVSSDHLAAVEWRALVEGDADLPTGWHAGVNGDQALPVAWQGAIGIASDHALPVLISRALNSDSALPALWQGMIAVDSDHALPVLWRSGVAADASAPVAFEQGLVSDQAAAVRWLASIGVDMDLLAEWRTVVVSDQAAPVKWNGTGNPFVDGVLDVWHLDGRGRVWRIEARSRTWRLRKR